jgi:hypothetical protein
MLGVILCLFVAGCGGGSASSTSPATAAFKAGYEKVRGPLNETGKAVANELMQVSQQTDQQIASAFGGLARRFHARLAGLDALKPPASMASAFAAATYAANRVDVDLRSISTAASRHSSHSAAKATSALGRDITAMKVAAGMIKHDLGLG